MELARTALQAVINEQEHKDIEGIFYEVCKQDPNIVGVMAIGSLIQNMCLPDPCSESVEQTQRQKVYEKIRNPQRRRIFPSVNSDLDLWVCTANPEDADCIQLTIENRAMQLIDYLVNNPGAHGGQEWVQQKAWAFDQFYKQSYLYSSGWMNSNNGKPWNAENLKGQIVNELMYWLPDVVNRINHNFNKQIPGDFIEMRAFPQCTFNLRPEELIVDGIEDRRPFPRIVNSDWLDIRKNTMVLYVSDQVADGLIYPFDSEGVRLGSDIEHFLREV